MNYLIAIWVIALVFAAGYLAYRIYRFQPRRTRKGGKKMNGLRKVQVLYADGKTRTYKSTAHFARHIKRNEGTVAMWIKKGKCPRNSGVIAAEYKDGQGINSNRMRPIILLDNKGRMHRRVGQQEMASHFLLRCSKEMVSRYVLGKSKLPANISAIFYEGTDNISIAQ